MWQTNEVVKFDGQFNRILLVLPGEVVQINLELDTARPEYEDESTLSKLIDTARLFRHKDPFDKTHLDEPAFGSIAFKKREQGLQLIKLIMVHTLCFDPTVCAKRLLKYALGYNLFIIFKRVTGIVKNGVYFKLISY